MLLVKALICLASLAYHAAAVPVQDSRGTGIVSSYTLQRLANHHQHSQIALGADTGTRHESDVDKGTSSSITIKLRSAQLIDGVAILEDSKEALSGLTIPYNSQKLSLIGSRFSYGAMRADASEEMLSHPT